MKYDITEILNIEQLELLLQKFIVIAGVATAIIDLKGNILMAAGWQDICTKFHRVNPDTCKRCIESDVFLANQTERGQKFNMYKCLNGMVDIAVPIHVNNKHIANLFIGQFLLKKPNMDFFKSQAKEFNFDEEEYLEALSKVTVLSEEQVKKITGFLSELATHIGESGYSRLKFRELSNNQEQIIKERTWELKRSNEELEQFAYVSSHDLQEPLRKIKNYTQLLETRYKNELDDKAQKYIEIIVNGTGRMQMLIDDLLSFSRVTTKGKEFEKTDLSEVLSEALSNLEISIKENSAEINYKNLPVVMADESQLILVFQNLISNAIKFRGSSKPVIDINCKDEGEKLLVSVKDNGIGFDMKFSERIFTVFQRLHTREEYKGTGIGLAICKKIIERHGGTIWAESRQGEGSIFHFTLRKHKE